MAFERWNAMVEAIKRGEKIEDFNDSAKNSESDLRVSRDSESPKSDS